MKSKQEKQHKLYTRTTIIMTDIHFEDTTLLIEILCGSDDISYSEDQSFSCICLNNEIICQLKNDKYPPQKMQ